MHEHHGLIKLGLALSLEVSSTAKAHRYHAQMDREINRVIFMTAINCCRFSMDL